jgi:hypothetical protein
MKLTLGLLLAIGCYADISDGPIQEVYQSPQYSWGGFTSSGELQVPGFDATLGVLQSVQVDWTANFRLPVVYQTAATDYSQVSLNVTSMVTASAFGFTGTGSQQDSFSVTAQDCYGCYVNASVAVSGGGTVTDPAMLNDFIGGTLENNLPGRYAIFEDSVSAGAVSPTCDAACVTGQIAWPTSYDFTGSVKYDFTPVPEPRYLTVLFIALAIGTVVEINRRFSAWLDRSTSPGKCPTCLRPMQEFGGIVYCDWAGCERNERYHPELGN